MTAALDALPDDPAALKAIIQSQQEDLTRFQASVQAYEALVQALKIRIARLQKQKFGPSSEKVEREIAQLQLALEDLEVSMAAAKTPEPAEAAPSQEPPRQAPRRRGRPRVSAATPRERIVLDPGSSWTPRKTSGVWDLVVIRFSCSAVTGGEDGQAAGIF